MKTRRLLVRTGTLLGLWALPACGPGGGGMPSCDAAADADADGLDDCRELELGLSPEAADTDGDGYSDLDELVNKAFSAEVDNFQFNPRIADLPRLEVHLSSVPSISLEYQEDQSTGRRLSTGHSEGTASGVATTAGGSASHAVEVTHTVSVSVSAEVSATPSVSAEVGYEYSHATTNETSTNWSREQTQENTRVFEESEELERTAGVSFTGGELAVTVSIANPGHIAYELSELTLTAYESDARRPGQLVPVGTLTLLSAGNSNVFPKTVIEPGEVKAGFVFRTELDLGTARALLRDSRNLVIRPATFAMTAGERTFGLETTEVNARTAEVIIDLDADRPLEAYRVAVAHLDRPTVGQVMRDILAVPVETGIGRWRDDVGRDARPTESGLVAVRNVAMDEGTGGYFLVAHSRKLDRGVEQETRVYSLLDQGYDFEALPIRQGDVLHVVHTKDADRDGIPERLERSFGTTVDNGDSDGDGLSDLVEYIGWQTPCDGTERTWVYPDPTSADSDADGIDDETEWTLCTDPTNGIGEDEGR